MISVGLTAWRLPPLSQPLADQHNKVIADLWILEINFEQLFISYGHHLPIFNAFDGRGSPSIWSKERVRPRDVPAELR